MKIAELLRRDQNSASALREAIGRAEAAGQEAAARLERLTGERTTALLNDDEKALDRIETALVQAQRDADRADLALIELRSRLEIAEAAEAQKRLDDLHAAAEADKRRAVDLIRRDYAKLAHSMRDLLVELRVLDDRVTAANAELERAGDPRRVASSEEVARAESSAPVRLRTQPIHETVCLPSPTDPARMLYPDQDIFGSHRRPLGAAA